MRLPRDLSVADLIKMLKTLGYVTTRQVGSHIRLTTVEHGYNYPRSRSSESGQIVIHYL